MNLPEYWLQRPEMEIDSQTRLDFDQLFDNLQGDGIITRIEYSLSAPKWQFLCYLADHHGVILHGTGDPDIRIFEPRKSYDLNEFGAQTAVYAAGDGLWAMFYAIVDRTNYSLATSNACIRLVDQGGQISDPFYVFSISQPVLDQQPWRNGVVYLLPGETFVIQPSLQFGPYEVRVPHMASLVPVESIAQLEVTPEDFPFLKDIRGIDDDRLDEYGTAMQNGAPWPG